MENLFTVDYFKNEVRGERTVDLEVVKGWLNSGEKVGCIMRELTYYMQCAADFEVEDVVEQEGEIYIKSLKGLLFPFIGFSDKVHVLKRRHWEISDWSDGKPYHMIGHPPAPYTRDLDVARMQLQEGKVLVCTNRHMHTSKIKCIGQRGGVDYITTQSGSIYILEGSSQIFKAKGVLKWPSEMAKLT